MAPRWRQLFDTWEKAVAPGLEELTASAEFRDVTATMTRWNAAARRQSEAASRQWLHAFNLPAATDIRRLRRQIAELEREVGVLRRAMQDTVDDRTTERLAALARIDGDATNSNNATTSKSSKNAAGKKASAS
ncbi:MAG: poly(R)-hydroxyalkanoic acid synthase subunit PhaE [Acidimicrobiales bacterium]